MSTFCFSSFAVAELENVLGEAARPLISQLEMLVGGYRAHGNLAGDQTEQEIDGELCKLISAFSHALERIECASPRLRSALANQSLIELAGKSKSTWHRVSDLDEQTRECLKRLKRYLPRRKRGPRVDASRRALAFDIATVMMLSGLSITTSRAGQFAKVLTIALTEAYDSAPVDPFRLIKYCTDILADVTPSELRRMVKMAPSYSISPTFWQTF
jgi:hypothetical protein